SQQLLFDWQWHRYGLRTQRQPIDELGCACSRFGP
ncbi:hypothetical protein TorRG33x02_136610, partial [Trema orientale]